ncbi:hypothetical protein [Microcoleus sp. F10-B6]|uniref:hypothetical protein n=1 Tax=Microcoleus sp. F10-B6 TaxID=2818755 RepID=UPI002FD635BA
MEVGLVKESRFFLLDRLSRLVKTQLISLGLFLVPVAVAVFLAVVLFGTVFSVPVSDLSAAVLVDFLDLLLVLPPPAAGGLYGPFAAPVL